MTGEAMELRRAIYVGDGERLEVRQLDPLSGGIEIVEYYDDGSGNTTVMIDRDHVEGLVQAMRLLIADQPFHTGGLVEPDTTFTVGEAGCDGETLPGILADEPLERRAYSIKQVADALGVSRTTVSRMANEGRIRSVKLGGRRVIPADQVDELLTNPPES